MTSRDDPTRRREWPRKRRGVLQALGGAGLAGVAGCADLVSDGDDSNDPEPAAFSVTDLTPADLAVDAGEPLTVSATVTNTGEEAGGAVIRLVVAETELTSESVTLDGDESTTVSFDAVELALEPGAYAFGVASDTDEATGTLTIAAAGPYSVADTDGVQTDVLAEEGRVGRYMYEYDPSDTPSEYEYMEIDDPTVYDDTFKPYLHVWDPAIDEPLTSDPSQEGQFAHHRGIYIGWDSIEAFGEQVDNWHDAPTVHQRYEPSLDAFDEEQALTAVNHWLTEPDGDVFVTETREMRFREPQTDDGVVVVDCTFTLEFETDVGLYGDPEHGGIQFRANDAVWENGSAAYYFSDHWDWGENPGDGTVDEAYGYDWIGMACEMHGQDYFVVQMNHPDNPVADESTVSAYREYGRFGYYWEGSFSEGEEITVSYRFVVERGGAPAGQADAIDGWFADYVDAV